MTWQCRDFALSLDRVRVMGILNVTPDSFSDGGRYHDVATAVAHGVRLTREGADLVDVGGESSRPGAVGISAQEELKRVLPVVKGLVKEGVKVSVDTRKAEVARAVLDEGACVINDISAGEDKGMFDVVRDAAAGMVLMRGGSKGWWDNNYPDDIKELIYNRTLGVKFVNSFLTDRLKVAIETGIKPGALVIDPGIGFTLRVEDDVKLLCKVKALAKIAPVMVGVSRKRFIGRFSGETTPAQRLGGNLAAAFYAVSRGAMILRAHDAAETVQALKVLNELNQMEKIYG